METAVPKLSSDVTVSRPGFESKRFLRLKYRLRFYFSHHSTHGNLGGIADVSVFSFPEKDSGKA